MSEIGFIGVGNMGAPMVRNLLRAGHRVTVSDLSSEAVQAAQQAGARAAWSAAEAARNVDVVITMLPAGRHVRDVYLSQNGLLTTVPKGSLFIDSSTIDIESARAVAAAAADFDMVDAPVSG